MVMYFCSGSLAAIVIAPRFLTVRLTIEQQGEFGDTHEYRGFEAAAVS
jgi:hypothetical protein